jgi:hypothetical protein
VSAPRRTSLDDVFTVLRAYLSDNHSREEPVELHIPFRSGRELRVAWPDPPPAEGACSHSPDFRQVVWYGTTYRFSATQAAVIKILWEAREQGTPEVGGATLLEGAGSEASRVRDLFRSAPAWDDGMIGPAGKGMFRLYSPEEVG